MPSGFGIASWVVGTVYYKEGTSYVPYAGRITVSNGMTCNCLPDGSYVFMIVPGTYTMTGEAKGLQDSKSVTVPEASTKTVNFYCG